MLNQFLRIITMCKHIWLHFSEWIQCSRVSLKLSSCKGFLWPEYYVYQQKAWHHLKAEALCFPMILWVIFQSHASKDHCLEGVVQKCSWFTFEPISFWPSDIVSAGHTTPWQSDYPFLRHPVKRLGLHWGTIRQLKCRLRGHREVGSLARGWDFMSTIDWALIWGIIEVWRQMFRLRIPLDW